jgi:heavy metal sensor kinase
MDRRRIGGAGLSIGAKLALRYALATSATMTVLGAIVYGQIQHRINRQATLVLEVQSRDLADAIDSQLTEHPRDHVLGWFDQLVKQRIAESPADLGLGIELFDAGGGTLVEGGSLRGPGPPFVPPPAGASDRSLRAVDLGGEHAHLLMTIPVAVGFVRVAIDTQRFARNVQEVRRVLLWTLPVVLLATAALGWLLARASLRPIHEINRTAREIGGSNLDSAIPTTGSGDELDQLAGTLNEMISRIRASMERERRFTGNAAHQLLTPLAAIRNQIDVTLARARAPAEYLDVLDAVRDEASRMAEEIDAMLRLARSEGGLPEAQRRECDLGALLRTVVGFFEPLAADGEVELCVDPGSELSVRGDASWLTQLFSNLLSNAIKYTPKGGRVTVMWRAQDGAVAVRVADTGPGIGAEQVEAVFERFHRGRVPAGSPGFGLGLPIAREIARAHGGDVEVERSSQRGTSLLVTLPIAADEERRGA